MFFFINICSVLSQVDRHLHWQRTKVEALQVPMLLLMTSITKDKIVP